MKIKLTFIDDNNDKLVEVGILDLEIIPRQGDFIYLSEFIKDKHEIGLFHVTACTWHKHKEVFLVLYGKRG